MNKVIWKYPLHSFNFEIKHPAQSKILTIQMQDRVPTLWMEVDPTQPQVRRRILTVPTGEGFEARGLEYIGTVQSIEGLVWHMYDGGLV